MSGRDTGSIIMDPARRIMRQFQYRVEDTIRDIPVVRNVYNTGVSQFQQTTSTGMYNSELPVSYIPTHSPMDPLINQAAQNADRASARMNSLQARLAAAGDNPPPGLLAEIQLATQAYQAWMQCLKSCCDAKGSVQERLSSFR